MNLEPLACRIHDAVVVCGSDEEQELCFDWYQKQAIQEPCPACQAIENVLREHTRTTWRRALTAAVKGVAAGFLFFMAGVCVNSPHHGGVEQWTTVAALLTAGCCMVWSLGLKRSL